MTTLGGQLRPLTASDMAVLTRNMNLAKKRFKGEGLTPRQVIDLASTRPLKYLTKQPKAAVSDIDKARSEIKTAVASFFDDKSGSVRFITRASQGSKSRRHHVIVKLNAYKEALQQLLLANENNLDSMPRKVANWLRKQKVAFTCDCERHRYFLAYVATVGGFEAGRPENGFPKIRNPDLNGVACMHVLRTLTELESSGAVLAFLTKALERKSIGFAKTQARQKEVEQATQKSTVIKTSEQRQQEAMVAQMRRSLRAAASRAPTIKKIPAGTRRVQSAVKKGGITPAEAALAILNRKS